MENSRVETAFSYGKISIIKNFCFNPLYKSYAKNLNLNEPTQWHDYEYLKISKNYIKLDFKINSLIDIFYFCTQTKYIA